MKSDYIEYYVKLCRREDKIQFVKDKLFFNPEGTMKQILRGVKRIPYRNSKLTPSEFCALLVSTWFKLPNPPVARIRTVLAKSGMKSLNEEQLLLNRSNLLQFWEIDYLAYAVYRSLEYLNLLDIIMDMVELYEIRNRERRERDRYEIRLH